MLMKDYTKELFGLEGVIVTNVVSEASRIYVYGETKQQAQVCPACRHETKRIHAYQYQPVKDLPLQGKPCILQLKKRRYYCPYYSIASEIGISSGTAIRILDQISYPLPKLPKVLSIDEFKGNAGGRKYQCILADPLKRRVLDILPSKNSEDLVGYFLRFPTERRNQVEYLVMDMSLQLHG